MEAIDLRMTQEIEIFLVNQDKLGLTPSNEIDRTFPPKAIEIVPVKREQLDQFASEQAAVPQEPKNVEVKREPCVDDGRDNESAAEEVRYLQPLETEYLEVKQELYSEEEEEVDEEGEGEDDDEEEEEEEEEVKLDEEEEMSDVPHCMQNMLQVVMKVEDDACTTWKEPHYSQLLHSCRENDTGLPLEARDHVPSSIGLKHKEAVAQYATRAKNSPERAGSQEGDVPHRTPYSPARPRSGEKQVHPNISEAQLECGSSDAIPVAGRSGGSSSLPRKTKTKSNSRKARQHCCEFCGKVFSLSGNLTRHRRIHTGEQPYQCEICGKAFSKSDLLAIHRRIHTGEQPFKCNTCAKTFTQAGHLRRHTLKHTGQLPYSCDVCGKSFARSDWMKNHRRTHTGEQPYTCEVCGKSFTNYCNWKKHSRTHTGEQPYKCEICGKSFARSDNLKVHRELHSTRIYRCEVCGEGFFDTGSLRTHRYRHDEPYSCEYCGKSFNHPTDLTRHRYIHINRMRYPCDICGKFFNRAFNLKKHRRIHFGEQPYSCDVCGRRFTETSGLNQHKRTHTGEMLYACNLCSKRFCRSGTLKKHMLKHARELNVHMYETDKQL